MGVIGVGNSGGGMIVIGVTIGWWVSWMGEKSRWCDVSDPSVCFAC